MVRIYYLIHLQKCCTRSRERRGINSMRTDEGLNENGGPTNVFSDWGNFGSQFSGVPWQEKILGFPAEFVPVYLCAEKFPLLEGLSVNPVVERVNMGQPLAVYPVQQPPQWPPSAWENRASYVRNQEKLDWVLSTGWIRIQGLTVSRTGSSLHILHSLDSLLWLQYSNRHTSATSKELLSFSFATGVHNPASVGSCLDDNTSITLIPW